MLHRFEVITDEEMASRAAFDKRVKDGGAAWDARQADLAARRKAKAAAAKEA